MRRKAHRGIFTKEVRRMPPVLGTIITLALLSIPVFFAGRYCWRDIKGALSGGSCGGCSGDCSSCGGGCSSCSGEHGAGSTGDIVKAKKGPTRYAINGRIVVIPGKEE